MLGENAGEFREGFLGFVFMVVGNEHDLLPFAGAFGADVGERGVRRAGGEAKKSEAKQGEGAHDFFYSLRPTGVNQPLRLARLTVMP